MRNMNKAGKKKKIILSVILIGIWLGCFVCGTILGASQLTSLHGDFTEKFIRLVSYVAICFLCIIGGVIWGIHLSKPFGKEIEIRKKVSKVVIVLVVAFFCVVGGLIHGAILVMVSI